MKVREEMEGHLALVESNVAKLEIKIEHLRSHINTAATATIPAEKVVQMNHFNDLFLAAVGSLITLKILRKRLRLELAAFDADEKSGRAERRPGK